MRLSDRTTGFFIFALGALAAYGGSRLPPVPGQQVGPSAFPMVIGIGLAICGLMIAFGIGRSFEEEAEADLAAHSNLAEAEAEQATRHGGLYGLRVLLPPALLLIYVYAVEWLGFIPTAGVIVLVAALAFGAKLRMAIPLAILGPIGVHLAFAKLLRVPLPPGLLPMPW